MKDQIEIIWSIDDVKEVVPSATNEEAREILQFCVANHDAEIGINWDVIKNNSKILKEEKTNG